MFKWLKLGMSAALMMASLAVGAMDLQQAKEAGWIGEKRDGYLGVVSASAPADARKLVDEVNRLRRQNYEGIAAKNKLDLKTVEQLAAEKAIQKTEPGHYVQNADGSWTRK